MIKTNIKMRVTPEQSKKVQEICFENGVLNYGHSNILQDYDRLTISDEMIIGMQKDSLIEYYNRLNCEEIDADLFIKTNGTCEETYLTKYTSQPKDLESALKKIENLHIALKKKVERNKNQALEITKLLEQKKDLANNYKMVECERNHFMLKSSEHELKINELENLLKEKDIIISYLRSELK